MDKSPLEGCTCISLGPKCHYKEDPQGGKGIVFENDEEARLIAISILDYLEFKKKGEGDGK